MLENLPGKRLQSISLGILLLLTAIGPALAQPADVPRDPAASPAAGMILYLEPSAGAQPPYTLHRIYPDETGDASVDFGTSLDIRRALISPDGSQFALYVIDAGNIGRIYLAGAGGEPLDMIPVDATHMGLEDWHPSGDELLVWRFSDGQYDLMRLALDGQVTPLTNTPGIDERDGRWSPNGQHFSFTADGLDGASDVYVQQLNGPAVNITNSVEAEQAAEWAPSGTRLAYAQGESIIVADTDGTNTLPLDAGSIPLSYGWSPSGEIYVSDADGDVATAPDDGSGLQPLLSIEENNWVADWGAAGTAPLLITPENVNISVEQGAMDPAPVSVLVDSEDFVTPWTATSGAGWLTVDPKTGDTPATVELSFKTSKLDAGLYAAPVTFLPGPRTLNVTVAVNPPGSQSQLAIAPPALSFVGIVGGPDPAATSIAVASTGLPLNWVASETAPWLSLSSTSGISPSTVLASVDTAGLSAGKYETVVTFQPGGHSVAVSLDLSEQTAPSEIILNPDSMSFTANENGAAPASQTLTINHSGPTGVAWSATASASWLQISETSGVTPSVIDVSVDPTGLLAGDYAGAVWIGQESVPVSLTVVGQEPPPPPPPDSGDVLVSPASVIIAAIEGGAEPGVKDLEIVSETGQQVFWTASADQTWVHLSATSGTTPSMLKVRADVAGLQPGVHTAAISIGDRPVEVTLHVIEGELPDPAFQATWARQDLPVDEGIINRTWLWGPSPNGTTTEPYAESPGGTRQVAYYDKSRMEISYPDGDRSEAWFVTNGLLAYELITGQIQLGDSLFIEGEPSGIPIAGDADDENGPRYASFEQLLRAAPLASGSPVVQTIDAAGNVGVDNSLNRYGVTIGPADPETGHTIASVFWDYLNEDGVIWNGAGYVDGPLFEPWFFATGLPITEPYWARVKVNGVVQDVLVQCFERRCLTYTPDNPEGWQVEQANVGMHYFRWRYERPA
ncbi:MAG: hypothetical protein R3A46_13465 [Thermomicrobiales bacterium]